MKLLKIIHNNIQLINVDKIQRTIFNIKDKSLIIIFMDGDIYHLKGVDLFIYDQIEEFINNDINKLTIDFNNYIKE